MSWTRPLRLLFAITALVGVGVVMAPVAGAQERPASSRPGSSEILDPFAPAARTASRRRVEVATAIAELVDPFEDLPRSAPVHVPDILDPFVVGRVAVISELLDPWAR